MPAGRPALILHVPGPPKTKENKGQFNKSFYFKTHDDIVNWEVEVNHAAIREMRKLGFKGPYTGRCHITAGQTFESWKRCDITNYWKSLNDALNGAAWMDDSQVDSATSVRLIHRSEPGVMLFIWFYDFDYNESFGTGKFVAKTGKEIMKYPHSFELFDLEEFTYKAKVKTISRPCDVPANRVGEFHSLPTLEERKEAAKATKKSKKKTPTKKRISSNGKRTVEPTKRTVGRKRGSASDPGTSTGRGRRR